MKKIAAQYSVPSAAAASAATELMEARPRRAKLTRARTQSHTTIGRMRAAKRKAIEMAEALKEQADDETRVAGFIASLRLSPSANQPAAERMHALRARLRDKVDRC